MSARDSILAKIRRSQEGAALRDAAAANDRVASPLQRAPIPAIALTEGRARVDQFIANATAVDATVSEIDGLEALPAALADALRAHNLPAAIRFGAESAFAGLDWAGLDVSHGPGRLEEPAALSLAQFGVAETGTLVLASGADNPVTLTFLSEAHFVVLREEDLKGGFEEMWAAWRERGLDPRTVNMVTGPSRSADIGQRLQLGAHGPIALHIFVVNGASRA
jgi:L-lactate dehydrogenase complex protein LldG